jgi:Lecithin retinol acyltransferase
MTRHRGQRGVSPRGSVDHAPPTAALVYLLGYRLAGSVSRMAGGFQPGDHLQVRRPLGYNHHGIYISDDRVIQFGSGVTLLDKARVAVDAVPLEEFEQDGTDEVVRHGYESWFGTGYHPPADEPWKIIERAEFMLKLQPKLRYNLIGHNCEHIANLCVSQYWGESYQVRRFFGARALATGAFMIWLASRSRKNLPLPGWVAPAAVMSTVLTVATIGAYNYQIKKFWEEIGPLWREHERLLSEDPRNGLTG